jgi:hypothetical protein
MWSTGRSQVGGLAVGIVTLGVVVAAGIVGTRGAYPADQPRLLSGAAWLASTQVGQLTLLDGSSAEVAAQVGIAPPGNQLDVAQQGSVAYAVDRTAGTVRRVEGTTFESTPAAAPLPDARNGLRVFAGTDVLYVLDTGRGVLTAADPRTLVTQGPPLSLTTRVSPQAASLDGGGRLWVLDPDSGDLVWLRDGQRHSRHVGTGTAQLAIADGAPVLVDTEHRTATSFDPASGAPRRTFPLDLRADDKIQAIGAAHEQRLYVVAARGVLAICDLTGPGCGVTVPIGTRTSDFGVPVEAAGRVFVPDYATGQVWVVDVAAAKVLARPRVLNPATRFQLLTRDGIVFFNDPDSENAGVIRLDGGVKLVPKYDPGNPTHGLNNPGGGGGENGTAGADAPVDKPDQPGPAPTPSSPGSTPNQPPPPPPPPPPPGAVSVSISVSSATPLVGDVVTLAAAGPPGKPQPVDAEWDFADGSRGSGTTVNHSWTAARTYQVTVTAVFPDRQTARAFVTLRVITRPQLTVQPPSNGTVSGGGISCPGTCSATFNPGQSVTLTATPAGSFIFLGWGGACGGTGTTCTLTMNGDKTVSASFGAPPRLTVQPPSNGTVSGGGINCPGTCTATFRPGQSVTLTARANSGFSFLGWGGSCGGTGTTCTLTMNGDKNVSARFGARPKLTVEEPNGGRVTGQGINCPGTCTATYNPGQRITLTARPDAGLVFIGWGGACTGSGTTCTLTMNGDKTVNADFGFADPCPPVCFRRGAAAVTPAGGTSPQMSGALQAAAIARRQAVVRGRRASSRR